MLIAACGILLKTRVERARAIALSHGWKPLFFRSGGFDLTGFIKNVQRDRGFSKKNGFFSGNTLIIYIEGDGFAWKNRHTLSEDPTPKNPIALRLAVQDQAPKVLYLGRACQYTDGVSSDCHPRYWSSHRYSPEVVNAMNDAVNQAKRMARADSVNLVGFSGGGVVAALLAVRRRDVTKLITIAANLDHATWTSHHNVTPLDGSLNPADFAVQLQSVPQIHFIGGKDDIVPESVVRAYQSRMADPSLTEIRVIPEYDHHCCWVGIWPRLQKQISARQK